MSPEGKLSADPLPIPLPLVTAGVAALVAALLACADTALTSLSAARLGALAKETHPRLQGPLSKALSRRDRIQARYLLGRVLSLALTLGSFATWLLARSWPTSWRLGCGAAAILLLALVVDLAASAGRRHADWIVPYAVWLLRPLELLLAPLAMLTHLGALGLGRVPTRDGHRVTETEVEMMVDHGARSGALDQDNAELIRNVLEFSDLTARDAMIPRMQVVAIRIGTPIEEVLRAITSTGHSRYPVYRDDIDDVFGLIYTKDLFRILRDSWRPPAPESKRSASSSATRLRSIVREPIKIVPTTQPLSSLLSGMRAERQHLALVVDEYGGTAGIITLEDVLEEIVGDIRDEHDLEQAPIVEREDGSLLVDAAVLLDDLAAYLGWQLGAEGQYESLGGMITDQLNEVPSPGTTVRANGADLIVSESDEKHVTKVIIVRTSTTNPPVSTAGPSTETTGTESVTDS